MERRRVPWRRQTGLTLIEMLIGLTIVGILAAIGVPAYLGFVQRAQEAVIIQYLRDVHNGQIGWRIETDATGFTGDFDELEDTGFIPDSVNFVRARKRSPRSGSTRETSSRLVRTYRLDLSAQSNPAASLYTYTLRAYPQNRSGGVRWFYIDQTGVIRSGVGAVGPGAAPL